MFTFETTTDLEFKDWAAVLFRRNKKCKKCGIPVLMNNKTIELGSNYEFEPWLKIVIKNYKKLRKIRYECFSCNRRYRPKEFW